MTTRSLRPSRPLITIERVVAALLIVLALGVVAWMAFFLTIALYLLFLLATILVVRSVPVEPGAWLGLRSVRRGLVVVITLVTLEYLAVGSFGVAGVDLVLLLALVLCDVALGRATRRIATADEDRVDERQEALRNRAHRIAYAILAISVGLVLLIAEVASPEIRRWISERLSGGAAIAFIQVLFFLPTMIIAWIEPDRIADEDASRMRRSVRARLAYAMIGLAIALPMLMSLTLFVLPVRMSTFTKPEQSFVNPDTTRMAQCKYFDARAQAGFGFGATIPLSAVACWDGSTAFELWGLNSSDCLISSALFVTITTTQCRRTTGSDGRLHFGKRTLLRSVLLPFVSREIDLTLDLTKDGKVVQFP
jgi:hypothetical protein